MKRCFGPWFCWSYRCFSMQSEPILPSYSWMLFLDGIGGIGTWRSHVEVCRFPPLNWGNSPKTRWLSTHRRGFADVFCMFFTFPSGKIQRISGDFWGAALPRAFCHGLPFVRCSPERPMVLSCKRQLGLSWFIQKSWISIQYILVYTQICQKGDFEWDTLW